MNSPSHSRFQTRTLVLCVVDLAGYAKASRDHSDQEIANFVDRYYLVTHELITQHGGSVVKFMGDAFLAVFPAGAGAHAVAAVLALQQRVRVLSAELAFPVEVGANIHESVVVEGVFGAPATDRYDVIGSGVNHTFLMGNAAGLRISEEVFHQLPQQERAAWSRAEATKTYYLAI
jgi:adenylate cyclase